MPRSNTLIFSIHPRWMEAILTKKKRYELRRRPPKLGRPSDALLYETSPKSQIRAACVVGPVISGAKDEVWERVGSQTCLNRDEYDSYFGLLKFAYAIEISEVREMMHPLSLCYLREQIGFVPPQAWSYASEELIRFIGDER